MAFIALIAFMSPLIVATLWLTTLRTPRVRRDLGRHAASSGSPES